MDLSVAPGLRLWLSESEKATDLVAQFHHASCDGLGAMAFLEDLLVAYALSCGAGRDGTSLRMLDDERLVTRARFGLTAWSLVKLLPRQLVGLLGVRQFLARTPVPAEPCLPSEKDRPLPAEYPANLDRQLSIGETTALGEVARSQGVTINDLLIRDWFLAMGDWRGRRVPQRESEWLRLTVPINLRTTGDRSLPAANVVSMVFLDRRAADFRDRSTLLQGVHREMSQIKDYRLGLTFVFALRAVRAIPGGLARMTSAGRCSATGVLTNCGVVLSPALLPVREGRVVAGDVVLELINCVAPIRPLTHVAMAVLTYAGRLRITLHYDPRVIGGERAAELLDTFVYCLRTSAGAEGTALWPETAGKAA